MNDEKQQMGVTVANDETVFPAGWKELMISWNDPVKLESEQIAGFILSGIIEDQMFRPGMKLPSIDHLAETIGALAHTPRAAYKLLGQHGIAKEIDGEYYVAGPGEAAHGE